MDLVVVIPGGDHSALFDVVRRWDEAGFVRPFLWCSDGGSASWSDGSGEAALLDLVAARPYRRIRLISLLAMGSVSDDLPARSESIRQDVARRLAFGQEVTSIGVLVPATGCTDVPPSVLSSRWEVNVVAVDEDRVDPRHAGREVRTPEELAAHAAFALVTVAGLWSGMTEAPFDKDDNGAGHQEPRVRLLRGYVRAIRSDGLPDEVVRSTLARRSDPEWAAELVDAVPSPDPDHLVDRASREFLDGRGIRLRRTAFPRPVRPRRPVTPRRALRMLWLFMCGRVPQIQRELNDAAVAKAQDRVEAFVGNLVFGDGTGYVVRCEGRPLSPEATGPDAELFGVAEALIEAVERPSAPRRFPDEWRDLRALAFGLIDGSDLPVSADVHRQVAVASAISPAPADGPVDEWLSTAPHSLLSRIGRRLRSDVDEACDAFVAAVRRLTVPPLARQEAGRRLWWLFLLIAGIGVLGMAVATVLGSRGDLTPAKSTAVATVFLLFMVIGTAIVAFFELRQQFQAAHRANTVWWHYQDTLAEAEHEAEEFIRLRSAIAEYEDWAPVVARVVHEATLEMSPVGDPPVDLAALSRPVAFGVAKAQTSPQLLQRLGATMSRTCFRRGWLMALYTRSSTSAMEELRFGSGLPVEGPLPDPDISAVARRSLREQVLSGLAGEVLHAGMREVVVSEMAGLQLPSLFSSVRPVASDPVGVGEFLDALVTPESHLAEFNWRLRVASSGLFEVPVEARLWEPVVVGLPSSVVTVVAVRVEATAPLMWSDVALFRQVVPAEDLADLADDEVG